MEKLQDNLSQWHYLNLDAVIEMSNDDDALISACLLSHLKGYPITYYTHFEEGIYSMNLNDRRERISVDLSKPKGKGYDNHFIGFSKYTKINDEMINVNNQLAKTYEMTLDTYSYKFAMGTIFVLYGAFKERISLPKSEQALMTLLTIDSSYKGFYGKHKKAYIRNLKYIGLENELLPVLEKHTLQDFEEHKKKVREKLPQNFYLNEETGYLEFSSDKNVQAKAEHFLERLSKVSGFPIALPKEKFYLYQPLKSKGKRKVFKIGDISSDSNLYCYAITDRGHVKSSYEVQSEMDFWFRI